MKVLWIKNIGLDDNEHNCPFMISESEEESKYVNTIDIRNLFANHLFFFKNKYSHDLIAYIESLLEKETPEVSAILIACEMLKNEDLIYDADTNGNVF